MNVDWVEEASSLCLKRNVEKPSTGLGAVEIIKPGIELSVSAHVLLQHLHYFFQPDIQLIDHQPYFREICFKVKCSCDRVSGYILALLVASYLFRVRIRGAFLTSADRGRVFGGVVGENHDY